MPKHVSTCLYSDKKPLELNCSFLHIGRYFLGSLWQPRSTSCRTLPSSSRLHGKIATPLCSSTQDKQCLIAVGSSVQHQYNSLVTSRHGLQQIYNQSTDILKQWMESFQSPAIPAAMNMTLPWASNTWLIALKTGGWRGSISKGLRCTPKRKTAGSVSGGMAAPWGVKDDMISAIAKHFTKCSCSQSVENNESLRDRARCTAAYRAASVIVSKTS